MFLHFPWPITKIESINYLYLVTRTKFAIESFPFSHRQTTQTKNKKNKRPGYPSHLQPSLLGTSLHRSPASSDFMSSENDSGYSTSYKGKKHKTRLIFHYLGVTNTDMETKRIIINSTNRRCLHVVID